MLIVETFSRPRSARCAGGAGVAAWSVCMGPSGAKAVEIAAALEIVAQMALQTLVLAPGRGEIEPELLGRHFKRKHGPGATYGQRGGAS